MKSLLISLITFNSHESTDACLSSLDLLRTEGLEVRVLVIDNSSKIPFKLREAPFKQIKPVVLRTEKNLGFSGGHNLGIAYALEHHMDYLLILNNDTIADPLLVASLVDTADSKETIGIVCPKIYFTKGSEFHHDRYTKSQLGNVLWYAGGIMDWKNLIGHHRGVDEVDQGQFDTMEKTEMATGCCLLVKLSIIKKVGMMDSRYFLYYEDADFSMRVASHGYSIMYEPKAKLWHTNAGSTGGSGSALQDYFISRNRLLFGFTYAPLQTKLALFRESMKLLRSGRTLQKRGVRDYYLKRLGKGSYGV